MNVLVNNKPVQLQSASALTQLLEQLSMPSTQGIAIAVNEQVIPKAEWATRLLQDKDEVLLIRATQGG